MGCGGCSKRREARDSARSALRSPQAGEDVVMGGYKYLPDRQIRARLEVYKKRYCPSCETRYECTYAVYVVCKNIQK